MLSSSICAGFQAKAAARHEASRPRLPVSSTPCSANTFLARSIPTATIPMDFPFRTNTQMETSTFPSWRIDAVDLTSVRSVRDGEVPRIR